MKKKVLISVVLVIIVSGASFGVYTYVNQENKYKNMISNAENLQKQGEFNKAEELYNDSLKMKHNKSVIAKIDSIKKSKDNLKQLELGDLLAKERKYDEALKLLNSLSDDSTFVKDKVDNKKCVVKKDKEDYETLLAKQKEEQIAEEKRIAEEKQIAEENRIKAEEEKQRNKARNDNFNSANKKQKNNSGTETKNRKKNPKEEFNIEIPDPSVMEKMREEELRRSREILAEINRKAMGLD